MRLPFAQPPDEDPREVLARTRLMWQLALFLPFVYIGIGWAVERFWFEPREIDGLWAMRRQTFLNLLGAALAAALGLQALVVWLRLRFRRLLLEARLQPKRLAALYYRRTLYLMLCADTASGLGLILFLLGGDWRPFLALCMFCYLLYVQASPGGTLLDDAERRP